MNDTAPESHGKMRSDDPAETNWKSSDHLLRDSTPYFDMQQNNDHNNNMDDMMDAYHDQYNDTSPQFGMDQDNDLNDDNFDYNPSQNNNAQKWSRGYTKSNAYNSSNRGNRNGFRSGISKRGGGGYINRDQYPSSFGNKRSYHNNNNVQRRRGGRGRGRGRGGYRRGGFGGYRPRGRGRGRGGYGGRGRGGRMRGRGSRGRGGRGRGRRFDRNRKPTTKEDLDRDLEQYLYGGDDGAKRQKNDLDDDLDSYWNDSGVNKGNEDEVDAQNGDHVESENEKVEDNEKEKVDGDEQEKNEQDEGKEENVKDTGDDKAETQ